MRQVPHRLQARPDFRALAGRCGGSGTNWRKSSKNVGFRARQSLHIWAYRNQKRSNRRQGMRNESKLWNREEHVWLSKCIKAEVTRKRKCLKILGVPGNERRELACGSFANSIGHSRAITLLVEAGYDGSALALARPCFDAFHRGLWLMHCATDEEVQKVGKAEKDAFPGYKTMMEAINTRLPSGSLDRIRQIAGDFWHSYTHGGLEQILGQLSSEGLEENYPPDSVGNVLMVSDFWHLFSAAELADAADNETLHSQFLARFDSYLDALALAWWGIEKFSEQ